MKVFTPPLRNWDLKAAKRPNFYIAISENVKKRIKKYYQRDAEVIYPPVDTEKFKPKDISDGMRKTSLRWRKHEDDYFLIVSRLVPYKKLDYAIKAFNKLGLKLKIVGSGIDEERLKRIAKGNIEFLGEVSDKELISCYQNCQALIFPQEEDFGLTAVEAQACGKPVIAFNGGGAKESVIPGKTGELYDGQNEKSLITALKIFQKNNYSPSLCRKNALPFSKEIFKKKMSKNVEKIWKSWLA